MKRLTVCVLFQVLQIVTYLFFLWHNLTSNVNVFLWCNILFYGQCSPCDAARTRGVYVWPTYSLFTHFAREQILGLRLRQKRGGFRMGKGVFISVHTWVVNSHYMHMYEVLCGLAAAFFILCPVLQSLRVRLFITFFVSTVFKWWGKSWREIAWIWTDIRYIWGKGSVGKQQIDVSDFVSSD